MLITLNFPLGHDGHDYIVRTCIIDLHDGATVNLEPLIDALKECLGFRDKPPIEGVK